MNFLDLIFSAAGGGMLGLAGTGLKMWFGQKSEDAKLSHELLLAKETRLNMELELRIAERKGEFDLELQESDNDAKGLQAAIQAEGRITSVHPIVNDIRALVRPVLTLTLVIFAFIKPNEEDIVWMASTAVTFWFGDRPRKTR